MLYCSYILKWLSAPFTASCRPTSPLSPSHGRRVIAWRAARSHWGVPIYGRKVVRLLEGPASVGEGPTPHKRRADQVHILVWAGPFRLAAGWGEEHVPELEQLALCHRRCRGVTLLQPRT